MYVRINATLISPHPPTHKQTCTRTQLEYTIARYQEEVQCFEVKQIILHVIIMISIYNIEINEKETFFPSRGVSKKYKFTGCLILSYKFIPSTAIKLDGEIWLYECLKYIPFRIENNVI